MYVLIISDRSSEERHQNSEILSLKHSRHCCPICVEEFPADCRRIKTDIQTEIGTCMTLLCDGNLGSEDFLQSARSSKVFREE